MLEIFANYIWCILDQILFTVTLQQCKLNWNLMLWIFELLHYIWSYKMAVVSVPLGPHLSSALGAHVVAHLRSIGILMCCRKCICCELLLIINNLPVCNFFRKPGNMLLRKLSICLIRGQNFILRTLRQNMPLVTGLWCFLLLVLMLNRMCWFMQGLCLCSAEYV